MRVALSMCGARLRLVPGVRFESDCRVVVLAFVAMLVHACWVVVSMFSPGGRVRCENAQSRGRTLSTQYRDAGADAMIVVVTHASPNTTTDHHGSSALTSMMLVAKAR